MAIFKTRQPFREDYVPDTVVARDDIISKLARIFQDFVDGSRPPHLLIHGDSGTGKRTVTQHILNLAELEVEQEIKVITIDCEEHTTLYQLYLELAYWICDDDYPHGTYQPELEEAIVREMDDPNITWYLVFENFEGVDTDNLPFNEVQQTISTYGTAQTECGVIGITNNSRLYDHLPSEVVHRPYMHTLETTPYDATQLRCILESRAEVAFSDDGLSETVIPQCAAIIAQETGSAAEALQLIELAGYIAHQADADQVTETHVDTATESREALDQYTTFTQELNPKEQLLCAIIAVDTAVDIITPADDEESQPEEDEDEDDEKITTIALHRRYERVAGSFGLDNVSKRRVEQLTRNLRDRGLVEAEDHNDGRGGGTWLSYKLTVPPHHILHPATATSGRYNRLLRKHHVSIEDYDVDIDAFLSDDWP